MVQASGESGKPVFPSCSSQALASAPLRSTPQAQKIQGVLVDLHRQQQYVQTFVW